MWIMALPYFMPMDISVLWNKVIRGDGSSQCTKLYINVPSWNLENPEVSVCSASLTTD